MDAKKKCIYTVLIGGYDNVIDPKVTVEDFDYICFVGKGESSKMRSDI